MVNLSDYIHGSQGWKAKKPLARMGLSILAMDGRAPYLCEKAKSLSQKPLAPVIGGEGLG
jgi:hypothetical protein